MAQQSTTTDDRSLEPDGFWKRLGERLLEIIDAAPVVIARVINRVLKFVLRGSSVQRAIRDLCPIVDEINALEAEMVRLGDEQLRAKTPRLRERVAQGETLDDILPEAFAVAREAADRRIGMCCVLKDEHGFDPAQFRDPAHRTLLEEAKGKLGGGARLSELMFPASFYAEIRALYPDYRPPFRMRPFDVQLIGGIVLHQGNIAEMVTGEGKTLVAVLPAYLNTLGGGRVHVVTVNDYLAKRDRDWNAPMFESLGLTVGAIQSDMDPNERKPEYDCDITYGTNNEFGFDYLRDNMKDRVENQAQGELQYGIIDEVDSILIDEARTPLIISGPAEESSDRYYTANRLVNSLKGVNMQQLPRDEIRREQALQNYDYTYSRKDHSTALTERGISAVQRFLGVDSIYHGRNMDWPPYIENALKAKELYKLDVHYVIRDGEVVIVDEFTGRLMPGRRWSDGLHQAVEAKEGPRGARIKEENQTLATITFQNFFRLYDKIAGMTGTALTEAGEFLKIYKLDVVPIPTNRPLRRDENPDLIYGSDPEKWNAIVEEIVEVNRVGRPILVGTVSIENSEKLSRLLERRGVKHEVLNAKHHEREAGIVALAGEFGAVTVATNMAGRGTDIVLGRPTWQKVFKHWQERGLAPRDLGVELGRDDLQKRLEGHWFREAGLGKQGERDVADEEAHRRLLTYWRGMGMAPIELADNVAGLGGLHIIGTERHEARRIDNQLRGRSGRQGDPGSSRFYVSLDDDLMKIFMGEWVRRFMLRAGLSDGQPLEHGMVTRALARAQRKVEERNFEVRKNLLEYDEVMDEQRKLIYDQRQEVLEGGVRRGPSEIIDRGLRRFLAEDLRAPSRALPDRAFALIEAAAGAVGIELSRQEWDAADRRQLESLLANKALAALQNGFEPPRVQAWVRGLIDDCRADGEPYPERWHLPRLARWAKDAGIECSREELAQAVRTQLAELVADAAREQLGGHDLDELLTEWFTVGYEQDLPLLSRESRWELDTFRQWLERVGVTVEFVRWTPATTTCEALLPRWLEAARERFAGRAAADVAAELAAAAADLYLGWRAFLARPSARRVAHWAERRLGLPLRAAEVEAAFEERVAPKLLETLAERLAARLGAIGRREACGLWAATATAWHLGAHLRFADHNVVALATYLSSRLHVGLNSLALAKKPPAAVRSDLMETLAERHESEGDGQHLEGLEDILFNMVANASDRLVDNALGERGAAAPNERSFAPLADWAHELGLAISEDQWQAFNVHDLRLHFLRQVAQVYPAEATADLLDTFVPRFTRRATAMFLASDSFGDQPSYGSLAAWAVGRFPFLPRDAQVEAQLKRFAEDKLKQTQRQLIEGKLADYQQEGIEIERAVDELVTATLDVWRATGEGDEVDFGGMAGFARRVFDISVSVARLEEDSQGEEREAVRLIAQSGRGRYARRGVEGLVADAVAGAFELCVPADQFPSRWNGELLRTWLRAVGLAAMLDADGLRDETIEEVQGYFVKGALAAHEKRTVQAVRAGVLTAAIQVFLETDLAEEGRSFIGLANAVANKYGIELDPFELSKLRIEEIKDDLKRQVLDAYDRRKNELGARNMLWTVRQLLLQTTDVKWKDHLYNMDHLRGVIGFRGYGQKDPKIEYKREGYEMFEAMTTSIEDAVTDYILKVEYDLGEEDVRSVWQADSFIHEAAESYKQQQEVAESHQGERPAAKSINAHREPGRNDPCPCGKKRPDGRPIKYKNCCGRRGRRAS